MQKNFKILNLYKEVPYTKYVEIIVTGMDR
jgi:hypothetical protein